MRVKYTGNTRGKRPPHSLWTNEKEKYLRENYLLLGCKECARVLGINYHTVASHARRLGISKRTGPREHKSPHSYGEIIPTFWHNQMSRAKHNGKDFNIDAKTGWEIFLKQGRRCGISGELLTLPKNDSNEEIREATASLDRIDSSLGYSLENCEWIHKRFQQSKMNTPKKYYIEDCCQIADYQRGKYVPLLHEIIKLETHRC